MKALREHKRRLMDSPPGTDPGDMCMTPELPPDFCNPGAFPKSMLLAFKVYDNEGDGIDPLHGDMDGVASPDGSHASGGTHNAAIAQVAEPLDYLELCNTELAAQAEWRNLAEEGCDLPPGGSARGPRAAAGGGSTRLRGRAAPAAPTPTPARPTWRRPRRSPTRCRGT